MVTSLHSFPGRTPATVIPYRVLVSRRLRDQLRGAPPQLRGHLAGVVSVLRVDPYASTVAFETYAIGEAYRLAMFPAGHGYLGYTIVAERGTVLLTHLAWG